MGRNRKYQRSWEEEGWARGWLRENKQMPNYNVNDQNEAYCLYCHTSLRAHAGDLKRHSTLPKHQNKAKNVSAKGKGSLLKYAQSTSITEEQKITDLTIALYIAFHSSIRSVDHLGEILKKKGKGSHLENLKLHRTKCSCLIKNVLAAAILQDIVKEIGDKKYSIIVDESTDVSVNKYIALCIRYFSDSENSVITDFLGLVQIAKATAKDLYDAVKIFLTKNNIPLNNMLSIGTDGASNLCGQHNSLYTLLKNDSPDLILLKCSCHSIHLSVSKAAETLPTALDFIARETYNWFSNSPLRKMQYKEIFDLINYNENKEFKNFIQLSGTRWLARYNVIKRILENWLELKTFFGIAAPKEKCYTAKTLNEMLKDDKNFLYFTFLKPVLADMNELNLYFQSESCDLGSAYHSMFLSVESLARRIIKPLFLNHNLQSISLLENIIKCVDNDLAFLPVDLCDLGYDFSVSLHNSKTINNEEKLEMTRRCSGFLKSLLKQLVERLPSNFKIYSKMKLLNPHNSVNNNNNFHELPINSFILPNENKDVIENQWRKLPSVPWADEFNGTLPNNTLEFWPKVYTYCDNSSRYFFKDLATVVLRMLCLPISNAMVERAFSIMAIVKTKIRNRMRLEMLESIMRIRIFIKNRKHCCHTFCITPEMLRLFTSNIYCNKDSDDEEDLNTALELMDYMYT